MVSNLSLVQCEEYSQEYLLLLDSRVSGYSMTQIRKYDEGICQKYLNLETNSDSRVDIANFLEEHSCDKTSFCQIDFAALRKALMFFRQFKLFHSFCP